MLTKIYVYLCQFIPQVPFVPPTVSEILTIFCDIDKILGTGQPGTPKLKFDNIYDGKQLCLFVPVCARSIKFVAPSVPEILMTVF